MRINLVFYLVFSSVIIFDNTLGSQGLRAQCGIMIIKLK